MSVTWPAVRYASARRSVILVIWSFPFVAPGLYPEQYVVAGIVASVLYLSLVKMSQAVPSVIRCCYAVSPESPVFWRVSCLLRVSCVGPASCTVVDGVGPSPVASPAVAPGACRCTCCVLPSFQSSRPRRTLRRCRPLPSPSFLILDRNRFRVVVVCLPDGPPATPGADFGACGPPPCPSVSARADFRSAPRDRPPAHRFVVAFHHFLGNGTDSKNLFIGQYDKFFEEYWLSQIL